MSDDTIRFTSKLKGASDVARLLRRYPEKVRRTLLSLVKQEARGLAQVGVAQGAEHNLRADEQHADVSEVGLPAPCARLPQLDSRADQHEQESHYEAKPAPIGARIVEDRSDVRSGDGEQAGQK